MLINKNNQTSFRGYDARPLEYLVIRHSNQIFTTPIAKELQEIGRKNGFKVAWEGQEVFDNIPEDLSKVISTPQNLGIWLQDQVHFMKNKFLSADLNYNKTSLHNYFGLELEKIDKKDFVEGGNMFFVNHNGTDKIIVGANEAPEKVKNLFKTENIIRIPQADFHLDLFIKPLKNGFVLVADDDMTIKILEKASKNLSLAIESGKLDSSYKSADKKLKKVLEKMQIARKDSMYSDTNEVIKTLKDNGLKPIKVPGRIYYPTENQYLSGLFDETSNILNYLNSIVHQKEDGKLVLITNKSNLFEKLGITKDIAKKIGLDFEQKFKLAIKDYVSTRDIYFVKGRDCFTHNIPYLLEHNGGGIHCLCAEVPKGIRNADKAQPFDEYAQRTPFASPQKNSLKDGAEKLWQFLFK